MEVYGSSQQETIEFSDENKYIHIKTTGLWTDSKGNYGSEICYGSIINNKNEVELKIYCKGEDFEGDKYWSIRRRSSSKGAGVGINEYIKVDGKFNFLVDANCTYGVNFFNENFWFKQKCNL